MSNTSEKKDCSICCDTTSVINITQCPFCDILVCKQCLKRYILEQRNVNPNCMNCKKILTRSALASELMFNSTYFIENELKAHIKNIMFEEEKLRIPEVLQTVATWNKYKEENKEFLKIEQEFSTRYVELTTQIDNYVTKNLNSFEKDYIYYKLCSEKRGIKEYLDKLRPQPFRASHYLYQDRKKSEKKSIYTFPCANADCLGRINEQGLCDVCNKVTCKDCFVLKGDKVSNACKNHKCKDDDLETANYIRRNSKPCPKCGISISHGGGCAQMWCANCHHVFNWKTGVEEKGNIHNPEYFRYMRDNNIEIPRYRPNGNPCNDSLNRAYSKLKYITNREVANGLRDIYRVINHITDITIPMLRCSIRRTDHRKERFELVVKIIDEKQFKTHITKDKKHNDCIAERLGVVEIMRDIIQDAFINFLSDDNKPNYVNITKDKANEMIKMLNNSIDAAIKADKRILQCYNYTDSKNLEFSEHTPRKNFIPRIVIL